MEMRMEHASMNGAMYIQRESLWLEVYSAQKQGIIEYNAKMDTSLEAGRLCPSQHAATHIRSICVMEKRAEVPFPYIDTFMHRKE